jgi:hypothetical protein
VSERLPWLLINRDTGTIRYAVVASGEEIAAVNARLAASGSRLEYVSPSDLRRILARLTGHA